MKIQQAPDDLDIFDFLKTIQEEKRCYLCNSLLILEGISISETEINSIYTIDFTNISISITVNNQDKHFEILSSRYLNLYDIKSTPISFVKDIYKKCYTCKNNTYIAYNIKLDISNKILSCKWHHTALSKENIFILYGNPYFYGNQITIYNNSKYLTSFNLDEIGFDPDNPKEIFSTIKKLLPFV